MIDLPGAGRKLFQLGAGYPGSKRGGMTTKQFQVRRQRRKGLQSEQDNGFESRAAGHIQFEMQRDLLDSPPKRQVVIQ